MAEKNTIRCLECRNGTSMHRTKRALAVKILLFWLPIKRYKCTKCSKKTYILGTPKPYRLQIVN
jgi:hypothetical protein